MDTKNHFTDLPTLERMEKTIASWAEDIRQTGVFAGSGKNPTPENKVVAFSRMAARYAVMHGMDPMQVANFMTTVGGRPSWNANFYRWALATSEDFLDWEYEEENRPEQMPVTYGDRGETFVDLNKVRSWRIRLKVKRLLRYGEKMELLDKYSKWFSVEDALNANLQKSNGNWKKFPGDMLRARVMADFGKEYLQDYAAGVYFEDEVYSINEEPEPVSTPQPADTPAPTSDPQNELAGQIAAATSLKALNEIMREIQKAPNLGQKHDLTAQATARAETLGYKWNQDKQAWYLPAPADDTPPPPAGAAPQTSGTASFLDDPGHPRAGLIAEIRQSKNDVDINKLFQRIQELERNTPEDKQVMLYYNEIATGLGLVYNKETREWRYDAAKLIKLIAGAPEQATADQYNAAAQAILQHTPAEQAELWRKLEHYAPKTGVAYNTETQMYV